ncbi:cobalt ABC transporter permease [Clostridium novyi B str. ATCC 27606]|uniref:Cobalt ABC transporter permease n=2 Tax=Clostridium TaxID=1485 RepID=A0AA40ISQ0_CLONO|nr:MULTISPECIES: cobalt ECF transporter T component CbiQ [Clostridium]KEI11932.1 cobalt ABC transporter permease [Clostridium novyi B str. NCTC 9691]KEI13472.1 cobalt ABC transporter permease [Clostridium novyi B str. ATCC 27606]KEI17930.1 cobalt ABC transporter permease [Clostridium haemolyticum NCTC 9693]KGN01563.1 cobalt ABC transporter permease [Clostridium haemolyticum NCTC 8350]OOB75270.1 cobalt ABC transporter permease [Clostridium haemolyticum]
MISIDKLSYISKLRHVNPMEKFIFAMTTMFFGIFLNNLIVSILIFYIMSFITLYKGKIPFKSYYKLILMPLFFLIIGTITIAINLGNNNNFIFRFSIFGINIGCTKESIYEAVQVLLKSMSSVTCLYFLALTTPIVEVLLVLKKLRMPKLFIELMGLIYRLIFILFETMNTIYISQKSRLGYSSIRLGYNSLGKLITILFIKAYKKSQDMYTALESRCYSGDINVIEPEYSVSYKNILMIIFLQIILVIIKYSFNI